MLWLISTLVNLWFGVSKAGYSIDAAPVALVEFAVPAVTAIRIGGSLDTGGASAEVYNEKPLPFFSIALLRDLIAADGPDLASKQWA